MTDRREARDRCDIDDTAAAAREHLRAQVSAEKKWRKQIDRHDALPLRGASLLGGHDEADAGIVDQSVDGAVLAIDHLRQFQHKRFGGDIAANTVRLSTQASQSQDLFFDAVECRPESPDIRAATAEWRRSSRGLALRP